MSCAAAVRLDPNADSPAAQRLRAGLASRLVGQAHAIESVVAAWERYEADFSNAGRPLASFLFLGPTGTGKTRIVEALADHFFLNPKAVLKIECGEFQQSHEISKLIGSPPGYLGHRETLPRLSQQAVNQFMTDAIQVGFILFDEIEKANEALWNLMLGILDKASLSLGDNRPVTFSRSMIFLTSNLGASELAEAAAGHGLGFPTSSGPRVLSHQEAERISTESARRKFSPEFFNRLDHIVAFHPLDIPDLHRILDIELTQLQHRIYSHCAAKSFTFSLTESARRIVVQHGYDPRYNARHLRRSIEHLVSDPLSRLLASTQIRPGDEILIDAPADDAELTFTRAAELP